jgi:hypothetical protein
MIVREIRDNPNLLIEAFDWFNDYKDTRSWAVVNCPALVDALDLGHDTWLREHNASILASIRDR